MAGPEVERKHGRPARLAPSADNLKPKLKRSRKLRSKSKRCRVATKLEAIDDLEEKESIPRSIAALAEMLADPSREARRRARRPSPIKKAPLSPN
jgi:hypothetical protein